MSLVTVICFKKEKEKHVFKFDFQQALQTKL